jgi:hypothetical protein
MPVTAKFLEAYITNPDLRHKFYKQTNEYAEAIDLHASGRYAGDLIEERRPAETKEIKDYRAKIFVAKTKPVFTKIYNSLQKINRSPDFAILFDKDLPARIPEAESLQRYIHEAIPNFGSLNGWFWNVGFRYYLIDANAWMLTLPDNFESADNEYYKPLPKIYTSEAIIDYREGEYFVLQTSSTDRYEDEQNYTWSDGVRFMVITPESIQEFLYLPRKGTITELSNRPNEIGYIPMRSMRGLCIDQSEGYNLYESRIAGIVPMLNEVLREYSDMQAEIVMHIHSTMWTIQPQACTKCKGRGVVRPSEESAPVQCKDCNGVGIAPLNPFEHLSIPMPKAGETAVPTPPMGYVQKQTDIARLQEERIRQHVYDALASIGMEFLADVPLSQSGVAKQVDREELYSFVYSVAVDCCRILAEVIYDMNQWRFKPAGFSDKELDDMLPAVTIPERFDLLSANLLIDEITKMSEAKVDPAIINAAQIDLVEKRFVNDPTLRDMVKLKLLLDPFAGMPEESITMMRMYNAVSQTDVVIHANINDFVNRALNEVKGFSELPHREQQAIIIRFAQEKEQAMRANLIETPPAE